MINKRAIYKKGFTLIETLVAVLVLMMAIAGPLTLAERGLRATVVAKDQDTAFYLAQDAIEFVRWVRDTNKLRGNAWLAGLDGTANGFTSNDGLNGDCVSSTGAQKCRLNSLNPNSGTTIVSCGAGGAACTTALNYSSTNNYFTYATGAGITTSIFTRSVSVMTPVGANDCTAGHGCEALVTVTVSWSNQAGLTRSIMVRESMFDWQ